MKIKQYLLRKLSKDDSRHQGRTIPIYIFSYHKGGSAFLTSIFREISEKNNWSFHRVLGKSKEELKNFDVVVFSHSLVDFNTLKAPFYGIHLIRDPRDIIVSGYLYHQRTKEAWCVNSDFELTSPILFPKVPYSQEYRSHEWKVNFLKSLNNMSYQENLLSMSQRDGLLFETDNYGGWTIESMRDWDYSRHDILELKFENLISDYDNTFRNIFAQLGFSETQTESAMVIASKHDIGKKSENEIKLMDHVFSRKTSKWKDYFEEEHKEEFNKRFGDLLIKLDYESNINW